MALTFGTLLSSQGADAHHRLPFGSLRGNLCNATRSVSQCQTDLLVPRSPDQPADSIRPTVLMACPAGPRFGLRSPCRQNISRGPWAGQIWGSRPAGSRRSYRPFHGSAPGESFRHRWPTTRTTLRLPTPSSRPATDRPSRSYCLAGTGWPSSLTAPASIRRLASDVLAASPAAASRAGRWHHVCQLGPEFRRVGRQLVVAVDGIEAILGRPGGVLAVVERDDLAGHPALGGVRGRTTGCHLGGQRGHFVRVQRCAQRRVQLDHVVRNSHQLAELLRRRFGDRDVVVQRLAHLLHAVDADQQRHGQHRLRRLAASSLQGPADQVVEGLVGAAEFEIGLDLAPSRCPAAAGRRTPTA